MSYLGGPGHKLLDTMVVVSFFRVLDFTDPDFALLASKALRAVFA